MKSLDKKLVISAVVAAAALVIGLTAFNPLSAIAQQQQANNSSGSSTASTATPSSSLTNETMPKITGSVNILQLVKDSMKVSFPEAAVNAQKEVPNGTVVGGHLGVVQGYLAYKFVVVDPTNQNIHMVIVDAGNGQVLYKSPAHSIEFLFEHHGFGEHPHWMMHGLGGWMK
jgi:uncharacterized membrane protein YkoI